MKILVIGSGGREHALVWKIAQSKLVDKIFCAPGNGGISQQAECVDIKAEDIAGLLDFARKEKIDLTVVGPEVPLVGGIVDEFSNRKLKIFGPKKKGAQLEASKVFAKEFMAKYNIPTADFKIFDDPEQAKKYINKKGAPLVIKADGLAQGKGVIVARTVEQAIGAVEQIMQDKIFGSAGEKLVVEDCLEGQEASILILTDGQNVLPLASSQDHKRVFDNDLGPNTGGMGAYSPAPVVDNKLFEEINSSIIQPTISGLQNQSISFQGVLYAGVMITDKGPKVLEFNVRFGDPETQAILPRLNSDLVETMLATIEGKLEKIKLSWKNQACICVVCASGGYPDNYEKGKEIFGLEEAAKIKDCFVFHAGTLRRGSTSLTTSRSGQAKDKDKYITFGGRVIGVTGLGNTIRQAVDKTYQVVAKINFEGMHYRKDIAHRALN
jgi:phosphoribosylamine--glycine ligase